MARKKSSDEQHDDGAADGDYLGARVTAELLDRNAGGGIETGTQDRVELPHEDAAEEAQSAANLAGQTDRGAIKRANFSRLASKRVSGVLERLSVLKQLSNTNTYEWNQDQHDKIFNAIDEQLKEVRRAFEAAKKPKVRDKSQLRFEV